MRKFKTREDARDWFRSYTPLANQEPGQGDDSAEIALLKIPIGHWILFQYTHSVWNASPAKFEISRPVFGLFVGISIWDQATVVNIVEKKRAWMWWSEVLNNPAPEFSKFYTRVAELDPEVESFELWTGSIDLLGHWEVKPTISELKAAMQKATPVPINLFSESLCHSCQKNAAAEPHTCPQKEELHSDMAYICRCCEDCVTQCKNEI